MLDSPDTVIVARAGSNAVFAANKYRSSVCLRAIVLISGPSQL